MKEKQYQDLILLDLKVNFHKQRVLSYEQGGDGVLCTMVDCVYLGLVESKRG